MNSEIFLSYSHQDWKLASALKARIEERGHVVFIDREGIDEFSDFKLTIYDALQSNVTHVVAVLTERAVQSRWVRFELAVAEKTGRRVTLYVPDASITLGPFFRPWTGGVVNTFTDVLSSLVAEPRIVTTPTVRWNLTTYPTPEFVGRDKEVSELFCRLSSGESIQLITGLGGVGKTQLVLELIDRHIEDYEIIWWIHCTDPATLLLDFATLGLELKLPGSSPDNLPDTANLVRNWLRHHDNWLLVFDGVDHLRDLEPYLLFDSDGHTVVTSRSAEGRKGVPSITLQPLPLGDALELLSKRTQQSPSTAMEQVAERLGFLPLALAQAGAYVMQEGVSFDRYLNLLEDKSRKLLEDGQLIETDERVMTTWDISLARVEEREPFARQVMDGVWGFASSIVPRSVMKPLCAGGDTDVLDRAIALLGQFSMITLTRDGFSLHPLVLEILRARSADPKSALRLSLDLLAQGFPPPIKSVAIRETAERLFPHVLAAARHADRIGTGIRLATSLLNALAHHQQSRSMLREAEAALDRSISMTKKQSGPDSPSLIAPLNHLGLVNEYLGKYAESLKHYQRALEIFDQTGAGEIDRNDIVSNIGALLQAIGDLNGAKSVLESLLGSQNAIDSFVTKNKLATVLRDQGELDRAEELFLEILDSRTANSGEKSEDVAQTLSDLAILYQEKGEDQKAEDYFNRTVRIYEAINVDHHFLGTVLHNRGRFFLDSKSPQPAIKDLQRSVEIMRKTTSENHRFLGPIHNALGLAFSMIGDKHRAGVAMRECLRVCALNPLEKRLAPTIQSAETWIARHANNPKDQGDDQ